METTVSKTIRRYIVRHDAVFVNAEQNRRTSVRCMGKEERAAKVIKRNIGIFSCTPLVLARKSDTLTSAWEPLKTLFVPSLR